MPVPELQPCWVLHARPYRETSAIVDFLTLQEGRVRAVIRGVRGSGRRVQQWRGILQPFVPLAGSWSGRHELRQVRVLEPAGAPHVLSGKALFCGLYVNELLARLLQPGDAHPGLVAAYAALLPALQGADDEGLEPSLRCFELDLLTEFGVCPDFGAEALGGAALQSGEQYRYMPELGFVRASLAEPGAMLFGGSVLQDIRRRDFSSPEVRRAAKWLARQLLQPLLGDRPLVSRELFESSRSVNPR